MIPVLSPHLDWSDFRALINIFQPGDGLLENRLCRQFKAGHCLTYASARAGVYHILKANGIKDKNILVSAYTCCVVAEAIVQSGNRPVFVDTAKNSFNSRMTKTLIKKQPNLGAVIITNLFGITDFSDPIWLKNRKFLLILDDSLSPDHISKRPDGLYDYVIMSTSVRKPFTCLGGGVVFTDSLKNFVRLDRFTWQHRLQSNRLQQFFFTLSLFLAFSPLIYSFVLWLRKNTSWLKSFFNEKDDDIFSPRPEYFYSLSPFQKRIGLNQLKKFNRGMEHRRQIGNLYFKFLKPQISFVNKYWRYNIPYSHIPFLVSDANRLVEFLSRQGIDTERYFDYVIPSLPQYGNKQIFPHATKLAQQIINLPISCYLKTQDIKTICQKITSYNTKQSSLRPQSRH
jgi:dTDP-4-amino-4,6-dideoxygalactose transaminase